MYKLIFLDADNTIFDYHMAEENSLRNTLNFFGYSEDFDKIHSEYKKLNSALWKKLEQKEITKSLLRVQRFDELAKKFNLEYNSEKFSDYYLNQLGNSSFLINGAYDLCKYLSEKYKVVILTNGIKEVQDSRVNGSNIKKFINLVITSDEVGINKPDPKIFEWAFDKINFYEKESSIIIGDSLGSDILGGNNTGIDSIWFNVDQIENTTGIKPTYTVDSLEEIKNIL